MFLIKEIKDVEAITAALEIILRVVSSSFMRKQSNPKVVKAIGGKILGRCVLMSAKCKINYSLANVRRVCASRTATSCEV